MLIGTNQEIGYGKINTESIVSIQGNGNYAAKICYDLDLNGFDDWYLPSYYEAIELSSFLFKTGQPNYSDVWTSSEFHSYSAYDLYYGQEKDKLNRVRAIRSF